MHKIYTMRFQRLEKYATYTAIYSLLFVVLFWFLGLLEILFGNEFVDRKSTTPLMFLFAFFVFCLSFIAGFVSIVLNLQRIANSITGKNNKPND